MALCHMIGVQRNHCGAILALPRCPLSLLSIDGVGERPVAAADPGRVGHQEWPDTRHHCWAFSIWFIVSTTCKSSENSSSLLAEKEIDADQEVIRLCSTEPTEVRDLPKRIPKDSARYHFFLYKHSHEGDYLQSTGDWIITCPNTVNRRIFR